MKSLAHTPQLNKILFITILPSVQVFPVKPDSGQRQEYFPSLSTNKHDCSSEQGTPQGVCQKMKNSNITYMSVPNYQSKVTQSNVPQIISEIIFPASFPR